jgi:hypothetical protein
VTDLPRDKFDDGSELSPEAINRLAAPLRAPVTLDEEFEGRVMEAVRGAGARSAATAWWRRGYTLRVTPLSGLALAASLALFAVLGRLSAGTAHRDDSARVATGGATAHDTVYLVRFALVNPDARQVSLVGDFNGWTPGATPLAGQGVEGVWTTSVRVTPGRHEYAFIVDGERWVADPYATTVNDEFGTSSSVLHVGDARHGSPDAQPAI